MTNSLSTKSPVRPPLAALRAPSARDIDIYKRVKIQGALQQSVAWHYKLDTSRVSQIVKKVRRWLAAGGAVTDPQVRDHAARQSLSRATHILRLQRAIEQVTFAMEGDRPRQKSTRSRYVGGTEIWREETVKPTPEVDLKAIRLLLRLTESLQKLQDQEEPPQAPTSQTSTKQRRLFELDLIVEQDLIDSVFEHLCRWRASVEENGRLPASGNIKALVARAIDTVLGTNLAADFQGTPGSGVDCANPPSTSLQDDRNRLPTPSSSQSESSPSTDSPAPLTPSSPPEPDAQPALNMSAPPSHTDSTTDAPPIPCDQPAITSPEKSSKHERDTQPSAGSKPASGAPPTGTPGSGIDCANSPSTSLQDDRNRLPTPSPFHSDASSSAASPDSVTAPIPHEPTAQLSLNMSAPPSPPDSTTDAPPTPCDQPAITSPEKSSKHERDTQPSAGSKPASGAPPTDSTSPSTALRAPPTNILSALACALLLLSGPLASALGGFPQRTAKVSPNVIGEWRLVHDGFWKDGASEPPNRPRNRIDLVTFSKSEQIDCHKAATSGRGPQLKAAISDRGLPAPKDRGHNQRQGSSPRPIGQASRRKLPRREA